MSKLKPSKVVFYRKPNGKLAWRTVGGTVIKEVRANA